MDKPLAHTDMEKSGSGDPLEAIYALNIGDFVADSFISEDLLMKISNRLGDDPGKLKMQLEELIQIYSIDKTLGVLGFSPDKGFIIYDSIASTLVKIFQADACHFFQTSRKENGAETLTLTGTSIAISGGNRWDTGFQIKDSDLLSGIYQDEEPEVVRNAKDKSNWHPIERLEQEKVKSLLATPLCQGGKRQGLLLIESYQETAFSRELVELSEAVGRAFITSIRLQQLIGDAQTAISKDDIDVNELRNLRAQITESIADLGIHQQQFVEALGAAIDARNHFTRGHSRYVAQISRAIAEAMELNEKTVDLVYYAGLVGTLGKIDIPQDILSKRENLSQSEWDTLINHPNVGVGLLVQINFLSEVIPYVYYQKERWDGSGGPEKLSGKSIPLGSRILAVADSYYAMTQERPYRQEPLSHDQALKMLQQEAGVKWDPVIVDFLAKIPADSLL